MSRRRFPFKALVIVLSVACFLAFGQGAVSSAFAAEGSTFETWPKKPVESGVEPPPPPPAKAGEAAGARTSEGISTGTWGWILAGVGAVALIAVAASGSSSTSNH